jgi:microsomal dipeptidase-like Zn-dependent dipeptidase
MSNLAFGGKLFHGAPDAGSLMPAVEMPWDPVCRFDNRAINIYEALSQDGPTHGPPLVPPFGWNPCGNYLRFGAILALEGFNDAHISPPQAVGYPSFTDWPKWDDITHQKMWIDWIRRDWEGGLRVMVALSHNNRMLAEVLGIGGSAAISGVKNDKASSDLQIDEIKKLVAAHSEWMAIARSSAELQSIVQGGKLAVVLGVEIDKIGDFSTDGSVTEKMVDDEIARLYGQGVRYIFPIHLTDNAFGDTAIYKSLFNAANFRETGKPWKVGCGQVADEVGFRSAGFPPELDPLIPPGTPDPPRAPDCVTATPNGPMFTGHVNTRTEDGLTSLGKFALKAMMKRGMIIDIDHMSDRAANWALGFANFPGGGYPLMSGHTGIRDRQSGDLNAENARTKDQLAQVACLGGMLGLGTDGMAAFHWAAAYNEAYDDMRRAFAPGKRCQEFTPLGMSFIGLGTDMNSLVRTPPPTFNPPWSLRITDIYNPNNPINAGLPPLIKSTTGDRTWDYNVDGVAHYGMYVDFLRDVRTCSGDPTNTCKQIVDDELSYSAENFYRMWLKAETQKVRVP